MSLQVLVSTMHQKGHGLLREMNIQSDSIIVNQCDTNKIEKFDYNGQSIYFLSLDERGVGLSRNTALMRATAEICLFADDDVTYIDGYKGVVIKAFEEKPEADVIIFNVPSSNANRPSSVIEKYGRVRWYNCFRYGTYQIAVRTEKLKQANIYFSLLFGGGAKYGSGEDSLFLAECIRKGLRVYKSPVLIGRVSHKDSTWYKGFTDKYFIDLGVFYACFSNRFAKMLCLQFIIRHHSLYKKDKSLKEAFQLMKKGIKEIDD